MRYFRTRFARLRVDVELIQGASSPFDPVAFFAGRQTPVFFGSGINNFGVREILHSLVEGRRRRSRATPGHGRYSRRKRRLPASCSRSRRTWTRGTATASRSSVSAPGATPRA